MSDIMIGTGLCLHCRSHLTEEDRLELGFEGERIAYHVIADPTNPKGWLVKRTGKSRASRRFDEKRDAVKWGRVLSKRHKLNLVVHHSDGTVAWKKLRV